MNEQTKKTELSKGKLIGYTILGLFVLGIITMMFADTEPSKNTQNTQPSTTTTAEANQDVEAESEENEPTVEKVAYTVHKTEDFSYAGCNRQGITLVVLDPDASQEDVDSTMKGLLEDYMKRFDEVTLWVYSHDADLDAPLATPDLGIYDDSRCK